MAKKLFDRLGNSKTRTLMLLGGVIVLVVVVIVIMSNRKPDPLKTEQSRASKIPQISAIPGNVTSEKYQELQQEDNRRRAEEAKTTGGSAVATIIGTKDKDALSKKESFGIEGEFLKGDCKCPKEEKKQCEGAEYNKEESGKLISQIEATPTDSLKIIQQNPCLSKALCAQNPDLAYKVIENNKELAKIMLNDCPELAKQLAEKNPALFKQLMLENPDLAKKISEKYPEIIKKLMTDDPDFAKKMAKVNPDIVKTLMKNDPDFANEMGKQNPEMVKDLMKSDPKFAKIMAKNNPGMVKQMMLDDPEFAKAMAAANPDMIKELMKNDPEFARKLAEKNPTLVKELMKNDPAFAALMEKMNPDMVKKLMADDPEFARAMELMKANQKNLPGNDQQKAQSIDEYRKKQKDDQAQRARQVQLNEQQQKQIAALMTSMESQSKTALTTWAEVSAQQFVASDRKDDKSKDAAAGGSGSGSSGGSSGAAAGPVLIKAGSILFAVLDTAINTDEPGPVMATIIQGKYKGAKVLGDVQTASSGSGSGGRPEKVVISFSTLSTNTDDKSITIKGVAIDPDTARTALASDVDHHYLLRYGTMFASSFLNGYAKVITAQGTVQTNSGSGSSTTTTPPLSGRQQIFAALGEVGKKFSDATSTYFSTPNTITVNSGTGFGLLILTDVTETGG